MVVKSTDGGNSWQRTGEFPGLAAERYTGLKLTQDANDANILLAATSQGLFRTTNGGVTWIRCPLPGDDATMVYDVEYKPGSSDIVYATHRRDNARNNGVFAKSTDGGMSFLNTSVYSPNVFTNVQRIEIAVSPASSSNVYLVAGPGNKAGNTFKGVWRSVDNGDNFARQSNSPNILGEQDVSADDQNFYDLAIAVSPTAVSTVVTGGLVVFRSVTSGVLFAQATSYFGSPNIHPDVHDLAFNPLDGKLYAATDGGVAVSSDNGISWTRLFNGLSCSQFYHFSMQDDAGDIWGGTQDNGILIKNGTGSSFSRYNGGDGYDVLTDMPPAGNQDDKYYSVNEKVYADATIDEDITPPGSDNFFANLGMSPNNEDIIYAGYERLWISYNRGGSWVDVYNVNGNYSVPGNWCLETCPSNSLRLYSAGRNSGKDGLFRIDNIGLAIMGSTNITDGLLSAGYDGVSKITDIAVHPSNSNRLWVTIGNFIAESKVYYSSNAGSTWINISNTLPNLPTNCILADGNGNVYVGTDIGVYYRGSADADWTPFYNNLPRIPVTELEFLEVGGINLSIYASTYGRGIWFSDLFNPCTSSLNITANLRGQQFFQAATAINSTSLVDGAAGTNVFFKAGESVILSPGFNAVSGTEVQTILGPCNSGPVPLRVTINGGDGILSITNNIIGSKLKGRIEKVEKNAGFLKVNGKIIEPGNYTIRIYDHDLASYIASEEFAVNTSGAFSISLARLFGGNKTYRADLFSSNSLLSMSDF